MLELEILVAQIMDGKILNQPKQPHSELIAIVELLQLPITPAMQQAVKNAINAQTLAEFTQAYKTMSILGGEEVEKIPDELHPQYPNYYRGYLAGKGLDVLKVAVQYARGDKITCWMILYDTEEGMLAHIPEELGDELDRIARHLGIAGTMDGYIDFEN